MTVSPPPSSRASHEVSRPVIHKTLVLRTQPAQRIADRVLMRTVRSLYSIMVIMPIIADEQASDKIINIVMDKLGETAAFLDKYAKRVGTLCEEHGVSLTCEYSSPRIIKVEISSPQAFSYVGLLERVDEIVRLIDQAWFATVIDHKHLKTERWKLQGHMVWLANQIIGIERRARALGKKQGKGAAVDLAAGAETAPVAELSPDDNVPAEPPVLDVHFSNVAQLVDTTSPSPDPSPADVPAA